MARNYEKYIDEEGAIAYAGAVHYQIYNGGFSQMMGNGYADGIECYGYNEFLQKLSSELKESGHEEDSKEYKEMMGAMSYVCKILSKYHKCRTCSECGGDGYYTYENEEEDEDGEVYTTTEEESCDACEGEGWYDVDTFEDCDADDLDDNDSAYYSLFNGDIIDDVTEQSHNHSVALDAIEKSKKED